MLPSVLASTPSGTPALPALRARVADSPPMDAVQTEPTGVDAPLPTLRVPRDNHPTTNIEEEIAPLPTLRSARAPAPISFEPEDENTIVIRETRKIHLIAYEQGSMEALPVEGAEAIRNPVNAQNGQMTAGTSHALTAPFLTPSTDRSMVGQTMRSFESRTGTVQSPSAKPTSKAATSSSSLARTTSSSTVVTFDDVAPSELEIYSQAGLIPTTKGEKVGDHRIRTDENALRVATHIVAILRRIDQLERQSKAQHAELLIRFEDVLHKAPATSTSTLTAAFSADIERLKNMTTEGRTAIAALTGAVNDLVDLPHDVTDLSRTVQNLTMTARNSPASTPQNSSMDIDSPRTNQSGNQNNSTGSDSSRNNNGSHKRDRPFAGFSDPSDGKRQKTHAAGSYSDVYLWDVNTSEASPMKIALTAIDRVGINIPNPIMSVQNPRNTPRSVISIRFRSDDVAEEFIDRLRANPPPSMAKLHAARPSVYEKKSSGASDKQGTAERDPCLRIVIWNINGRLAVKITQPHIVRLINDNDVIIFQETFLRVGEERTLTLPPGFEIIAMSRPDVPGLRNAWGGVAAVIRITTPYRLLSHLSAPDLIVLDLDHLFLIGAYILPAGFVWTEWTNIDPQIKLTEAVTTLSVAFDKPLMVGGDINGRIGDRIPTSALLARTSSDPVVNTRGRWMLRLCSDTSMTILNGTTKESLNRGAFTSFQPLGASVIDYCFVSAGLVPRIEDGALRVVKSPVWSDHAQIQVAVVKPESRLDVHLPSREPRPSPILFNDPTPLDLLLKATLEACVSSEEAAARLYGPVYTTSNPVTVYIGTSRCSGAAAFALWWGPDCKKNCAYVLENGGSAGKASILAVLCVIRDSSPDASLYSPAQNNIDVLPSPAQSLSVPKVSTALREVPEAKEHELLKIDVEDVIDPDGTHRGRRRERELMHENLMKLLACRGKSGKDFWKLVRGWTDEKPVKPRVTLEQLRLKPDLTRRATFRITSTQTCTKW
ncbi:hypothetical protein B0H13DRAFT_1913466 [Mycena leptocephala]|nr:hypothetical protein B0H13DRAFT_1913466 [Mycena leptocephala]